MLFINKVKHILSWISYIIKDKNYDWYYMLSLEKKKLLDMIDFFEHNESFCSLDRDIERMHTCVNLLNIILGFTDISETYININNSKLLDDYKDAELLNSISLNNIKQEIYINKAKNLYFNIKKENIFNWELY